MIEMFYYFLISIFCFVFFLGAIDAFKFLANLIF